MHRKSGDTFLLCVRVGARANVRALLMPFLRGTAGPELARRDTAAVQPQGRPYYGSGLSGIAFIASRPVVLAKSFGTANRSEGTAFFSTAVTSSTR